MKKTRVLYLIWLLAAMFLYFFENQSATRMMLAFSLAVLLLPCARRAMRREKTQILRQRRPEWKMDGRQDAGGTGDIREYRPGDPAGRIHWKLSAKRDELLVRTPDMEPEEEKREVLRERRLSRKEKRYCGTGLLLCLLVLIPALFLLGLPGFRGGVLAVFNRIFASSEAANRYVYESFSGADDRFLAVSGALMIFCALDLCAMAAVTGSRVTALGLMAGLAGAQAYFGVLLPGSVNLVLCGALVLFLLRISRPRDVLAVMAVFLAVIFLVLTCFPGVDSGMEAFSEHVRDLLSRTSGTYSAGVPESAGEENRVRHVHTRSMSQGDGSADPDREFRLVSVEEEQISMPHWVNYLRIVLLLLLTVLLMILPFLPFLLLNRKRRRAVEARSVFHSEDIADAVCAIFQHVIRWLDAMGYGSGNILYRKWPDALKGRMPDAYVASFAACSEVFEEAAYSDHPMEERQREQMLSLLEETEKCMKAEAGWKQRLHLMFGECLWI